MSPRTGLGTHVWIRWSIFSLLIVASTLYFPFTVIDTTVVFSGTVSGPSRPISPSSHRHAAFGLAPGIIAALRKPCGLRYNSTGHISAISGGTAVGLPAGPSMYQ